MHHAFDLSVKKYQTVKKERILGGQRSSLKAVKETTKEILRFHNVNILTSKSLTTIVSKRKATC